MNGGGERVLQIARLLRVAEQLAGEECRASAATDPALARLSALLWVSRDVADELLEQHVNDRPPVGRPEREHD